MAENGKHPIGGKYEILSRLGQGGAGQVFRARDLRLGKDWTVKRVRQDCPGMEEQVLSRVDGRLCPRIVDVVEEEGWRYLVMDLIDGESLEEHLQKEGPYGVKEAQQIGISLCDAILSLHRMQPPILYLDCKPANVMMDREGKLWLIDFGSAVEMNGQQAAPISASLGYAAPEQMQRDAKERRVDERSDVFGIGRTLYAILGGMDPARPPYGACRLRDCRAEVPAKLEKIVDRSTRKRPEERYQTVEALKAELVGLEAQNDRKKRRWALLTAGTWFFLALTVWQAMLFYAKLPGGDPASYGSALRAFLRMLLCAVAAVIWQRLSAALQKGSGRSYEPLQNVLRTEKKAGRWPMLLLFFLLAQSLFPKENLNVYAAAGGQAVWEGGKEQEGSFAGIEDGLPSPVILRDARMRKLLVKKGSVLETQEEIYLEIAPELFGCEEELEIRVDAVGRQSGRRYGFLLRYRPQKGEDGR